MISHFNKWLASKNSFDKELGTHHLMMVAWGCMVLYMYEMFLWKDGRFDDRPDKGLLDDSQFDPITMPISGAISGATLDPEDMIPVLKQPIVLDMPKIVPFQQDSVNSKPLPNYVYGPDYIPDPREQGKPTKQEINEWEKRQE